MRLSDLGKTPEDELTAPVEAGHSPPPEPVEHPPAENVQPESTIAETPAETSPPGFLSVLKNKNFVTLWSGQIFSQLADKVLFVLMIAIVESQFQSQNQSISGWVSAITILVPRFARRSTTGKSKNGPARTALRSTSSRSAAIASSAPVVQRPHLPVVAIKQLRRPPWPTCLWGSDEDDLPF